MKAKLLTLVVFISVINTLVSQTIWSGTTTEFTKADNADWTLEANQDRITNNVWITRKNSQGIFNINQETGYVGTSPEGTEWAYGTTSNIGTLTFKTWIETNGNNPPSMVGEDMVLHLITDDIYIDIKFTSWTAGSPPGDSNGGGFSYQRSTDSGLSTEEFLINKFTITPNPSTIEIKLNLPTSASNVFVKVFSVLGKEVYTNTKYEAPINVSNWNSGIYIVRVSNYENTKTKRFIKL